MNHFGTKQLETDRLLLRRFEEKDAEALFGSYINQKEFLYYANKSPQTLEDIKSFLMAISKRYQEKNFYNWVIVLKSSNRIVGSVNLRITDQTECAELNYAIDNRYTGNGYMTEALEAIKEFCLKDLRIKRLQGGCCIENIASKRVMEKSGLQYEDTLKQSIRLEDGYHDMLMYAIVND